AALLLRAGEDRLKIRWLVLARDNADLDSLEARCFEPAVQITFRESEPAITVEFARFLKFVPGQIEDHQLPARNQQAMRGLDRFLGPGRVMECLAEDHEIDAIRIDRRAFQIAQTELEILQSIFLRLARAE